MPSDQISSYYDAAVNRETRCGPAAAATIVSNRFSPSVAIDCRFGAGSDIRYLRSRDFDSHGFDLEVESIRQSRLALP